MSGDYDVIVVGGGAPGEHCGAALAARGLRVAVVERELVGGECSYWACIPSKTLLRPGEAAHDAREAASSAEVDVEAALAWRDFMVSDYSDAGQERWLADHGIDLLRGTGRLAGVGAVEVDGVRHTAEHVVLANGADPFVPPVGGFRELDGIWTNREVTGMKAVPHRLLILGGGRVGVEMAQAVRRLGGEVALVEGAEHLLPNEPAPLGDALGEVRSRDGIELVLGKCTRARRGGRARTTSSSSMTAPSCAATACSSPPVAARGSKGSASKPSASRLTLTASGLTNTCAPASASGRSATSTASALTHVGEYEGDVVAASISGDTRPANYEAVPRVTYTDPQAAAEGEVEAQYSATTPVSEVPKTATYTGAYAESNGFLTLLSDGERLTGAYALGPEAGEWLQKATLAIRAHVPLEVLSDTIQPFPSFSGTYDAAVMALRMEIADMPRPVAPMDPQMASPSG